MDTMLTLIMILAFMAALGFFGSILSSVHWENRPRLQPLDAGAKNKQRKKKNPFAFLRVIALVNKPLCVGPLGRRIAKDLSVAMMNIRPEEFLLLKEFLICLLLFLTLPNMQEKPDTMFFWVAISFVIGYMAPEFWLKGKIKKVKNAIIRELPDTIDLLALCVNAGLDFMLALKWVVEKSKSSILNEELARIMQEINLGKSRRNALSDFSKKYDLSDVSTFTRTLIQADRMGTSVAEALNILSEDMRLARFRRGEQIALKAPLKMLVPLLLFIFPVVGILVGGPIFLDFMQNNPMKNITGGISGK